MSKKPNGSPEDSQPKPKEKKDGTLNLPGNAGLTSSPPPLEGDSLSKEDGTGSLHVDPSAQTPDSVQDPNSKTILSDFGDPADLEDSGLAGMDTDSSFGGMRSDLTQTINPRQLDESERREVEAILKQAIGKGDSESGLASGTGESTVGGVESRLVLQSRQVIPHRVGDNEPADYRLKRVLGEGGMGTVFLAEQMSLERLVAVKVVKAIPPQDRQKLQASGKLAHHEKQRREQFLSEAVVTGALDHPNIVPIHDVGRTADNSPFYSMKQVEGTAWRDVISKNTLDENLEVLLKVGDAVAFAHSRGVVHRDIKPENVMLGDFGVVMLMDWGLAVVTPKFPRYGALRQTSSFGGSPAYMAPEMVGRLDQLTPSSDIYLLGAALFEIIAGMPPHPRPTSDLTGWETVRRYLEQVVRPNVIAEVPEEKQGELLDIALKAMATLTEDRYASVQEFQAAIRSYRSHAESIQLASKATDDLTRASHTGEYGDYARAVFGYEEAAALWRGNVDAQTGLLDAKLAYAGRANEKQDYDLGLSLLDPDDVRHKPLISKLDRGRRRRANTRRILVAAAVVVLVMSVALVGGGIYSATLITKAADATSKAAQAQQDLDAAERDKARVEKEAAATVAQATEKVEKSEMQVASAKMEADAAAKKAADETTKAENALAMAKQADLDRQNATMMADQERMAADMAKKDAEAAVELAANAKTAAAQAEQLAESEEYVSQIGLARSRIEQNEFEDARRILASISQRRKDKSQPLGWEWYWLSRQANQSASDAALPARGTDVTIGPDGRRAVVAMDGGQLQDLTISSQGDMQLVASPMTPAGSGGAISALSPDQSLVATAGGASGTIKLFDAKSGQPRGELAGHKPELLLRRLVFLPDGRLISASDDGTIRLWDVNEHRELAEAWHIGPVVDVAATVVPEGVIAIAAVADLHGGNVSAWKWDGSADQLRRKRFELLGEFDQHETPVSSVAISSDAQTIASGDQRGRVLVWGRSALKQRKDRGQEIHAARLAMDRELAGLPLRRVSATTARELGETHHAAGLSLTSTSLRKDPAHQDTVTRITFSSDGRMLLTASADYTAKLWTLDGDLKKTFRGHGGGVLTAGFLGADGERVLTTGVDRTVRVWLTSAGDGTAEFRAESVSDLQAHDDAIASAAFDATSDRIVTAGRDHSARIIAFDQASASFRDVGELSEDKIARPGANDRPLIEGARFVAFTMATHQSGRRLYVGDTEGHVRVWDMERAIELGDIPGTGFNFGLALSRDGKLLLTASEQEGVPAKLWRLNDDGLPGDQPPVELRSPLGTITALAISPDGTRLFTGLIKGQDAAAVLWDAATGEPIAKLSERQQRVNAAVFSADSKSLFVGSDDGLTQYDVVQQKVLRALPHGGFVTDVDVSENGQKLLTVTWSNLANGMKSTVRMWTLPADDSPATDVKLQEAEFVRDTVPQSKDRIMSARFQPGSMAAVVVSQSQNQRLSEVSFLSLSGDAPRIERTLAFPESRHGADLAVVTLDPATRTDHLLSLHGDSVFEWDLASLKHERSYRQASALTEAAFSHDGKYVATASRSVVLWDVATRKSLGKLETPHAGPVYSVSWNPTSPLQFATGGQHAENQPGKVFIWAWNDNTRTIDEVRSFDVDTTIRRVRWSPDGSKLLAVGDDGQARIWSLDQPAAEPVVFTDAEVSGAAFLCVEFSPDGTKLLAGGDDGVARIWKLDGNSDPSQPWARLRGHADAITAVGFLVDPAAPTSAFRYLTASRDKSARLWSVEDVSELAVLGGGEPIRVREVLALRRHDLGLTSVQASGDGHTLMTAGQDGRVILWPAGVSMP